MGLFYTTVWLCPTLHKIMEWAEKDTKVPVWNIPMGYDGIIPTFTAWLIVYYDHLTKSLNMRDLFSFFMASLVVLDICVFTWFGFLFTPF
jgi:hypothetical protein